MKQRENKIGKLGEKELSKWATQMDCTINKAVEDEEGWDFIVEFPPEFSVEGKPQPLDKADSPLKCWIQVKSTDETTGDRSVNLKNWLRLVKTPYPAFFLVFEFNGKDEPQKAFLIHIGQAYIRQVLKRLREIGSRSQDELHKKWMQFAYDSSNKLCSMNGTGLKSAIKNYVKLTDAYLKWKQRFVEEVGYEDGKYQMNITFSAPQGNCFDPIEHLVDLSLGVIPQLETISVEIKEFRFGIEAPELTKFFGEPGVLTTANEPVEKCTVTFRLGDYSRKVDIQANLYVPKGFKIDLEQRHLKIRFSAPFFEMIYKPATGEMKYHFTWPQSNEIHPLEDLFKISQIMLILHESKLKDVELQTEILIREQTLKGSHVIDVQVSQDVIEAAVKIESAWIIAKHFEIQNEIELCISDLLIQDLILPVRLLLANRMPLFRGTYWLDRNSSHKSALTYWPHLLFLPLNPYAIFVAIVVTGFPESTGNFDEDSIEWKFTSDVLFAHKELCLYQRDVDEVWSRAKTLLNFVIDQLDDSQQIMLSEDVQKLINE